MIYIYAIGNGLNQFAFLYEDGSYDLISLDRNFDYGITTAVFDKKNILLPETVCEHLEQAGVELAQSLHDDAHLLFVQSPDNLRFLNVYHENGHVDSDIAFNILVEEGAV